jgi:hypothetical protein
LLSFDGFFVGAGCKKKFKEPLRDVEQPKMILFFDLRAFGFDVFEQRAEERCRENDED